MHDHRPMACKSLRWLARSWELLAAPTWTAANTPPAAVVSPQYRSLCTDQARAGYCATRRKQTSAWGPRARRLPHPCAQLVVRNPNMSSMRAMEAAAHLPASPKQRLEALASLRAQLQGEQRGHVFCKRSGSPPAPIAAVPPAAAAAHQSAACLTQAWKQVWSCSSA